MTREGGGMPLVRGLARFVLSLIGLVPFFFVLAWVDSWQQMYAYAALASLPLLVLYLWMLWDKNQQTLPDKAGGVRVRAVEPVTRDVRLRPKPWYAYSWGIVVLIVLVLTYVFGWFATQIDLGSLVRDAGNAKPLLLDLLQPELFERAAVEQVADAKFQIPCQGAPPPPTTPVQGQPYMVISRGGTCGNIGDVIQVTGYNFLPNADGVLYWVNPIGMRQIIRPIKVGADGTFQYAFNIPQATGAPGEVHEVEASIAEHIGPWQATSTLRQVMDKMVETVFLALMATTLSIIVSIPLSFLAARNIMKTGLARTVYYITRFVFNVLRAIEPLIYGLIFVAWLGIGPFAGVLALTLHSVASLSKLYSEAIESIDPGPLEAITATGANRLQTIVFGVVPQIIPPYTAFTLYRWDINVRMSTIIGLVGGGGLGFLLIQWINLLQYRQAATAVWAIAAVVAILDYASAVVREKIV
jgi:phosphonate transport system permease protein